MVARQLTRSRAWPYGYGMQPATHLILSVGLLLMCLTSGCTTPTVEGGDLYTGQWAAKDVDGKAYTISLSADGEASATWPGNPDETGSWTMNEDGGAEIRWSNGWRDIIHLAEPETTTRTAYRPGTPPGGEPAMVSTVKRTGSGQ